MGESENSARFWVAIRAKNLASPDPVSLSFGCLCCLQRNFSRVRLTGGSTVFQSFSKRLAKKVLTEELLSMVPERISNRRGFFAVFFSFLRSKISAIPSDSFSCTQKLQISWTVVKSH